MPKQPKPPGLAARLEAEAERLDASFWEETPGAKRGKPRRHRAPRLLTWKGEGKALVELLHEAAAALHEAEHRRPRRKARAREIAGDSPGQSLMFPELAEAP